MTTWSAAFAAQAASDLDVYGLLTRSTLPACHRLHYLQMWLEKLCKAHVYEADVEGLKDTHNVVGKVLPRLIAQHWRRLGFQQPPNIPPLQKLCREIDLLHPQIKDGDRRPDNVEYPWTTASGEVGVPARWKFSLAGRLYSIPGRQLLQAADRLTREPALFVRPG